MRLLLLSLFAPLAFAGTITGTGGGLSIPDFNTTGVSSSIVIADGGVITGNFRVTLVDLYHTWISDLTASITHVETGRSQTLFYELPKTSTSGGDGTNFSGIYTFVDGGNDLWAAALSLDNASAIPSGSYAASGPRSSAPVELSNFFNGESAAGTWRLTMSDRTPGDTGFVASWDLQFDATSGESAPEPATVAPFLAVLTAAFVLRFRRGRRARRNA